MVKPFCGRIPIKNLNTTENAFKLTEFKPIIHRTSDYSICTFQESKVNADRVKKLFSQLQLDNLNKEEQCSIEKLCAKYADIFYLEGDRLTTTDIYEHTINYNRILVQYLVNHIDYLIPRKMKLIVKLRKC